MSTSLSIKENFDLTNYNTMGVSAKASFFVEVSSVQELQKAVEFAQQNQLEILVIGGGSNMLFKSDFKGLVIHNSLLGKELLKNNEIKIAAGENWHELVLFCIQNDLGGIENLSLIPGSVGAAPIQNIGAYGVELQDVFVSLEVLVIASGEVKTFTKEECKFGYRDSIFKKELKGKVIITSVTLGLKKENEVNVSYRALSDKLEEKGIKNPTIEDVSKTVIEIRQSKLPDPSEIGNTGSFFKNPIISTEHYNQLKSDFPQIPCYPISEKQVKVPAGWLIDQLGWKGKKVGDAGVHDRQALVLVNHGNASGKEIWNLATQIRLSVSKKYDITLTPEVNIIG
ncbi:MAG: UDP-N-acetylmuramate dehydrogenase [Balneola sp.]